MRTIALLRFLAVLLALFSCLAPVRSAADDYINATYYFSDVTSNPLNVRRITVTYLAPSIELGRTNFSNKPIYYPASTYYMLTNGSITLSNLLTGYALRVAFSDGYSEPAITNYFGTNLSGTVFGNDYKTTALTYQNGSLVQWWYANPESYVASATLTNIIQAVAGEGGGTVQTNISYTAVTNLTSFGALTNNETRALYFSNTVWFADSIQAADSIEAVQFIGGGASLTGLSGTQITSGTISSNKLDATAYVAFMSGGGTGSGSTNVTDTAVGAAQVTNFNVIGTLTANNQSNTTLSVASAYFPYTNAGATFDGDGKLTSSGGVTQSQLAAGSYPINGQPITNYQSIISQLLNGAPGTSRSPGSHSQGGNNASNYIVSASGTSGILKTLFCHLDVGSTGGVETNIQNLDLLIYTDGTAAGNLTAKIRVADLLNCRFRYPTTNWTIRSTSRFLSFYTDPLSMRSGFPLYHFTLTLPMPFTNGISCRLTNTTYGGQWTHGYFQAQYELKSLPPELQSARLYITNVFGSITASASNYLFTTSGSTEIVGFQVGVSNHSLADIEGAWADKGIAFYIDSTLFTYDLDDWLENTYAAAFGQFIGYDLGWPHNDYDGLSVEGAMESYKWLTRDSIRSTNSMVIYSDAFAEIESAYYNFFYYKR